MRVGGQLLSRPMGLDNEGEGVTRSVHRKGTQNLDFEIPLRQTLLLHLFRHEGDFRILGALQNVLVKGLLPREWILVIGMGVSELESSTGVGEQSPAQPENVAETDTPRRKGSGMSSQEPRK